MRPQEELKQLLARQEDLNTGAQGEAKKNFRMPSDDSATTCRNRSRRAQSRISAAERKRRTRRLILIGSYMEHVTGNDPEKRDQPHQGT